MEDGKLVRAAPDEGSPLLAANLASLCLDAFADLASVLRREFATAGEPFGIPSMPAWRLLTRLEEASVPLRPSDLADGMHLTRGALTQMLQTLERRGLVRRVPDEADGRSVAAELTEAGRASLAGFTPLARAHEQEIATVLSEDELVSLLSALTQLREHVLGRRTGGDATGP